MGTAKKLEKKKQLRPYQQKIHDRVLANLQSSKMEKIPLIGMATGGGKTFTAYSILASYLEKYPLHRVLVLAHNQKILRANFQSEDLLDTFELSSIAQAKDACRHSVVVAIPATIKSQAKKLGNFDLIVTDEAHEHWGAKSVQKIIKLLGSPKQLLLTASHGQFPESEFDKHLYSVMQGYNEGYLAECSIQLVNTAWDFTGAYNNDDELKANHKISQNEVDAACRLVDKDLRSLSRNKVGLKKAIAPLPSVRLKYPKTLIACHSQAMADDVYAWFSSKVKANVSVSYAGSDKKYGQSVDPIFTFQTDAAMDILIVVRKGILGFDCPELECVVDITGSKNVERTQQLMGRLLRKSGTALDDRKTYFKVMPENIKEYTKAMMGAVVAIMHPENDKLWRGQWKKMPIFKKKKKPSQGSGEAVGGKKAAKKRGGDVELDEAILDFKEYQKAFEMRKHKDGEFFEIYADTTLEKISGTKLAWISYEEAKAWAQNSGITGQREWALASKKGRFPEGVPAAPGQIYKDKGWTGWTDFLGTAVEWKSYEEAREWARAEGIKSYKVWAKASKQGHRPEGVPSAPDKTYIGKGWTGWTDFFGTAWKSYEEAKKWAKESGITSQREWALASKKGRFPEGVPAAPDQVYKDKGWTGWTDFLGTAVEWKSYEEAKAWARAAGIKTKQQWENASKNGLRPTDIPSAPGDVYKSKGWTCWADFLGTTPTTLDILPSLRSKDLRGRGFL